MPTNRNHGRGDVPGFLVSTDSVLARYRKRLLFAVFLLALFIRVIVVVFVSGDNPVPSGGDAVSYDAYAREIVAGDWLGKPVSYREVGYPFFLSLVYRVAGDRPLAGCMANALLGALVCVLVFLLAERIFGITVAAASSLAIAFNAQLVFLGAQLLREALVTLLLLCFSIVLLWAMRRPSWKRLGTAALLLVVLVHTDARFLFHLPFVAAYLVVAVGGILRGARSAAVFLLVFLVGMIPWQVHNLAVYDAFVLVNTRTMVKPVPWLEGSSEAARRHTPEPHVRKEGSRVLTGARRVLYDITEFSRVFRFRGEVRNNSTAWEAPWSAFHNWSSILTYGVFLPFFFIAAWVVGRRRMWEAAVLLVPIVAHTILHMIKWGRERYRAPIEPMIVILAAYGMAWVWQWWRSRSATERTA